MSSFALLAHNISAPAPAFNSTFYATVATIIPVLFLAIVVIFTGEMNAMS
jgi:hypothetical protein